MTRRAILTLNGGSSTVKCGLFTCEPAPVEIVRDTIAGTGADALNGLRTWIASRHDVEIAAVGHRIVHGGPMYVRPQRVTPELVTNLRSLVPFAPNHLPQEIALIEASAGAYPHAAQCACFDTAFHATMPDVARRLPLPEAYASRGIRKYGFHGLSYEFLIAELARVARTAADGRVILAHLGNGSSLAAVHRGRSVDTTMGLTPRGGVMMGTRTGDIDPGVVTHLGRTGSLSSDELENIFSGSSGLLGVSGVTSDMKTLLAREATDAACRLAIDMYVYSIAKAIGALAAVLSGVDTIVFSGGIGEHAPVIRGRVLERLAWLGVVIDAPANELNAPVITTTGSRVTVRVIPTNEELVIARATYTLAQTQENHGDRS
jgi:acetate kinase